MDQKFFHRHQNPLKQPESSTPTDSLDKTPASKTNEPEIDLKSAFKSTKKSYLFFLISGVATFIAAIAIIILTIFSSKSEVASLNFPIIPSNPQTEKTYSILTGEEISDPSLNNSPTYCVQTPNGTDGARPQAGLNEAGVVFEAIAERGITRFAAIYQNPKSAVIGPIRSLRMYYLEWDTPFNCTVVHAGGADDALAALRAGNYRDLTENYTYMYRSSAGNRLWNNLFTTSAHLKKFGTDHNFNTSTVSGFSRLTPEAAARARTDNTATTKLEITTPTSQNTSEFSPKTASIALSFKSSPTYNVVYNYNPETNTYARAYASGVAHNVYNCPAENLGEKSPENVCTLTQLSPSVVIAMVVDQSVAADGYHENITAIGKNPVYIFQNGTAIKGTWQKQTRDSQIKFFDESGAEIALIPGQTFISAIPTYGSVEY